MYLKINPYQAIFVHAVYNFLTPQINMISDDEYTGTPNSRLKIGNIKSKI